MSEQCGNKQLLGSLQKPLSLQQPRRRGQAHEHMPRDVLRHARLKPDFNLGRARLLSMVRGEPRRAKIKEIVSDVAQTARSMMAGRAYCDRLDSGCPAGFLELYE